MDGRISVKWRFMYCLSPLRHLDCFFSRNSLKVCSKINSNNNNANEIRFFPSFFGSHFYPVKTCFESWFNLSFRDRLWDRAHLFSTFFQENENKIPKIFGHFFLFWREGVRTTKILRSNYEDIKGKNRFWTSWINDGEN